jgi:hypothetical protein
MNLRDAEKLIAKPRRWPKLTEAELEERHVSGRTRGSEPTLVDFARGRCMSRRLLMSARDGCALDFPLGVAPELIEFPNEHIDIAIDRKALHQCSLVVKDLIRGEKALPEFIYGKMVLRTHTPISAGEM